MSSTLPELHACLIVDDDEGVRELIADALTREGITSRQVATGSAALKMLEEQGPMLVLLDLRLPDMNGQEIALKLSQREPRIPFVVISGLSNTQLAIDLMKQGAVDFLIKDIAFLSLIPGVVKRALAEHERERKLQQAERDRKRMEQEILNISESERRRIGHDLHDDLCQRLAATKLKCEILATNLSKISQTDANLAAEISRQIAESTALCRSIAGGLSPMDLEGEGFMAAIGKLLRTAEMIHEVPCFFDCQQPVLVSNMTSATHLYRITQELINNAARHAEPSQINVSLIKENGFLKLEVGNDGHPFKDTQQTTSGMGLKIIRYRASALGATIHFHPQTAPETGTLATCLVPESSCNLTPTLTS